MVAERAGTQQQQQIASRKPLVKLKIWTRRMFITMSSSLCVCLWPLKSKKRKMREKPATSHENYDEGKLCWLRLQYVWNLTNTIACAMSSSSAARLLPHICFRVWLYAIEAVLEWGELLNLRIIIKRRRLEKITSFRFFEKDFYRQKGACVTSGGIFIDLSGVLRFPSGFFVYSSNEKGKKLEELKCS